MQRRTFLTTTGAAFAAMGLAAPQIARADNSTVRVMTFGSTWAKVLKPQAEAFKQETGLTIEPVIQNASAEGLAKLQASRANPGVDVWFTGEAIGLRAATDAELFLTLPKEKLPVLTDLMPGSYSDKYVSYWYFPTGIVYRPSLVPGGKITSWMDLFKPELKGKIAFPVLTVYPGRSLLILALLNGGSEDNVQPGLDFLKAHKDQFAMFHSSDTAARKALATGEIAAMLGSPSALKELADQGLDVAMICPKPTPLIFEGMMMVNGGNADAAATFINRSLQVDWQEQMTNVYNLAPVNTKAKAAEALVSILPTAADAVKFDEAKINENLGAWTEQFNAIIAG